MESAASGMVVMEEINIKQGLDSRRPSSDCIDRIAAALSKAQAVIEPAVKDRNNDYHRSKYATLDAVWEAARKPMTDNGLAITQMPIGDVGSHLTVETYLIHSSGQWFRNSITIKLDKPAEKEDTSKKILGNAQSVGSAITYAKRYGLAAILGITDIEDDDGNANSARKKKKEVPQDVQNKVLWIASVINQIDNDEKKQSVTLWLKDSSKHTPKATENAITQIKTLTGLDYEPLGKIGN